MKIVRYHPHERLDRQKISSGNKNNKSIFTCPVCDHTRTFKWKDFKKAHTTIDKQSIFSPELAGIFYGVSPLQRIESTTMGKHVSLLLEFVLDFRCRNCRNPFRIIFVPLDNAEHQPTYLVRKLLGPPS